MPVCRARSASGGAGGAAAGGPSGKSVVRPGPRPGRGRKRPRGRDGAAGFTTLMLLQFIFRSCRTRVANVERRGACAVAAGRPPCPRRRARSGARRPQLPLPRRPRRLAATRLKRCTGTPRARPGAVLAGKLGGRAWRSALVLARGALPVRPPRPAWRSAKRRALPERSS